MTEAREFIVDPMAHQGLLRKVALRYRGVGTRLGIDFDDLIAEGQIGLLRACALYGQDPNRNRKFSSYAATWICKMIRAALIEQGYPIHIPGYFHWATLKGDGVPTQKGLDPECLDAARKALRVKFISGYGKVPRRGVFDLYARDDSNGRLEIPMELESCIKKLPEREGHVIRLYYGFDGKAMSLPEIGREFGLTYQRIQQIHKRALGRLRLYLGDAA